MDRRAKTVTSAPATSKRPAARNSRPLAASDARTVDERLADALAQQAATAAILRGMSASPTDVQPTLDAIAERAAILCRAPFARVFLADGDRLLELAYHSAAGEAAAPARAVPLQRTSISGRATLDRATVHVADIAPLLDTEFPDARENVSVVGCRAVLAVPLLHQGEACGAIFLWRREPGLFTPDQVALVETFATQAALAIAHVRQFRATREALEQQTATSEILRVISRSQTDVQPVFDTIATAAHQLCRASSSNVFTFDGNLVHLASFVNENPAYIQRLQRYFPRPPSRGTAVLRAILTRRIVEVPDVLEDEAYAAELSTAAGELGAAAGGFRSVLAVPLLREGSAIGGIAVGRTESGPFPTTQVDLLKTFADQAVIAIENVRLFRELEVRNAELTEALEQRTATSEILGVISQSPTDVQPVFDTIAAAALRLCRASSSNVVTFDGEQVHVAALAPARGDRNDAQQRHFDSYPRPPSRDTANTRAILTCSVVAIPDVLDDPDYKAATTAAAAGYRSVLSVPLLRDERPVGAITVARPQPGPFPRQQVALLQTFADQAVIAIENVRLFKELGARNADLTEALDQQTATSEILRAISRSPTEVQPVFEAIATSALRLCGATSALLATFDGKLLSIGAVASVTPDGADALRAIFPRPPSRDNGATRAVLTRSMVAIPDVAQDPDFATVEHSLASGFRSVLALPLMREGSPIGALSLGRAEAGPFPDVQIALLQTFADQAVIAIENVRLFNELAARTQELTRSVGELRALGEVGQAVSSTLDLETVLSTIVSRATQLTGMDGGSIYEYDETREEFHLHTADRLSGKLVEALRAARIRKGEGALGRMAVTGEPVQITDIVDESSYQSGVREILIEEGYRSVLAVPLLREDHLLGGLAVNRRRAGDFDADVIALLQTFATQSALAIQNARLFRELEAKGRQLEIASKHKSDFLANMSHELRTPLNAIIGFSEVLSERYFGEINDKQAEYVHDIHESGQHLLALINDILDLSKVEAGRMELDMAEFDLATAIANTLSLVRERAQRRSIALRCDIDAAIGAIHADERKVKQVLLNLLSNALKFAPDGGAVGVRALLAGDWIEVAVTDTGLGIAPEDQEAVFEEFRQVGAKDKKIGGIGLGLAISRKFIELHGGRLRVASELGKGATFTFTLPRR
jgi:GAF domain-containing protein